MSCLVLVGNLSRLPVLYLNRLPLSFDRLVLYYLLYACNGGHFYPTIYCLLSGERTSLQYGRSHAGKFKALDQALWPFSP